MQDHTKADSLRDSCATSENLYARSGELVYSSIPPFSHSLSLSLPLSLRYLVLISHLFSQTHDNVVATDTYNMPIRTRSELNFKRGNTRSRPRAEMQEEFSGVAWDSYSIFPGGPLRIQ